MPSREWSAPTTTRCAGSSPRPARCGSCPSTSRSRSSATTTSRPYNLVFDGERLTGVIDWDVASPGPRVWDLAYAAYRFVPLASPDNPDIPYPGVDEQARRLARLCAAYGAADVTPRVVLDTAAIRLHDLNAFMHREAAAGNAAQQAIIDRGRGRIYDLDAAYLEAHADEIAAGPR